MSEKTVNVYEFLTQLREQRVNMVQTLVSCSWCMWGIVGGRYIIYTCTVRVKKSQHFYPTLPYIYIVACMGGSEIYMAGG